MVDVSPGYARNYLFPRNLAVEANKQNLAKLKQRKRLPTDVRSRNSRSQRTCQKIGDVTVTLKAKSGENDKLLVL